MVFFTVMNYVYVSRGRHLNKCLFICLRRSTSETELEFLFLFTFINIFYENINQEYNLPSDCAFVLFTYRVNVVKVLCHASVPAFVLN